VEYAEGAHELPELDHPVPLQIKHIEHLPAKFESRAIVKFGPIPAKS
jgi:hypothetical protein